jgi:hypothetical protein
MTTPASPRSPAGLLLRQEENNKIKKVDTHVMVTDKRRKS